MRERQENSLAIDCPRRVLRDISESAGKQVSGEGGAFSGVLLGVHDGQAVRVRGWRPAGTEPNRGKLFSNLDREEIRLERAIALAREDDGLKEYQVVGWFVARRGGELSLTDSEADAYARLFPLAWHVALVIRPGRRDAAARFFGRGCEETAENSVLPEAVVEADAEDRSRPPRWQPWTLAVFGWVLLVAAAAVFVLRPDLVPLLPGHVPAMRLRMSSGPGTIRIEWNAAELDAKRGALELRDGVKEYRYDLDAGELRRGSFTYASPTGDLSASLTVFPQAGGAVREWARFVAPRGGSGRDAVIR